jgi:hypothetical protein
MHGQGNSPESEAPKKEWPPTNIVEDDCGWSGIRYAAGDPLISAGFRIAFKYSSRCPSRSSHDVSLLHALSRVYQCVITSIEFCLTNQSEIH